MNKADMIQALVSVGVEEGMAIEAHFAKDIASHTVSGAQSIVDALLEVIGKDGTILMPLKMTYNSEVSRWENLDVSFENLDIIRKSILPYDKFDSEASEHNPVIDNFRRREGVVLSSHPNMSFIAKGKYANHLCNHQSLHFPLSTESPIARLMELRGYCLLFGEDLSACCALAIAQYVCETQPIIVDGAMIKTPLSKQWKKFLDVELTTEIAQPIMHILERLSKIKKVTLNDITICLVNVNDVVEETTRYLEQTSHYNYYR